MFPLSNLTSIVIPWWGRALAVLILASVAFGMGYTKGLNRGQERLEVYQAKVSSAASEQEFKAAQTIRSNTQLVGETEDAYQKSMAAVDAYYANQLRLAKGNSGGRNVSSHSSSSCSTDSSTGSRLDPDAASRLAKALIQIKGMNEYWQRLCQANACQ